MSRTDKSSSLFKLLFSKLSSIQFWLHRSSYLFVHRAPRLYRSSQLQTSGAPAHGPQLDKLGCIVNHQTAFPTPRTGICGAM